MSATSMAPRDLQLPASPDSERMVLGAVTLNNALAIDVLAGLKRTDFHLDSHRKIYDAIADLVAEGSPIDTLSLSEHLASKKQLAVVGGASYLSDLTEGMPRRVSVEHYIKIIRDKSLLRSLVYLATGAQAAAADGQKKPEECMAEMEQALLQLRAGYLGEQAVTLKDRIRTTLESIHRAHDSEREVLGYRFGIKPLDDSLMGIRRKELVLIAAPPGRAKTALALQLADQTALESLAYWQTECQRREAGDPAPKVHDAVAMFSLEMADDPLLRRMLAKKSGVPARYLRSEKLLTEEQLAQIDQAGAEMGELEQFWHLDDTGRLKLPELISRARLAVRSKGCGLVIVDHIGLVKVDGRMDKNERLIKVTDELRVFAKEENVCVVMLYHTAKPPERDINRIPTMFDVRDATEITDNSHIILLPFREVMTEKLLGDETLPNKPEINEWTGRDMIFVGKHRESEVGGVPVRFQKRTLQYVER